jgi:hypothetical protein
MKIRLALAVFGLAISFVLPTFAQQEESTPRENTPRPTPAPSAKIQPSVTLPGNYKLVWNQDFTGLDYVNINTSRIVNSTGISGTGARWFAWSGVYPGFARFVGIGVDKLPFSTNKGYLSINSYSSGGTMVGGLIRSAWDAGFAAVDAYWEAKLRLPSGGSGNWPAFWLSVFPRNLSSTRVWAEVDIMEFGYQVPGSTNSNYQIHTHLWGLGNNGTSAGDGSISNLAVTPGGWHSFGCLIQQASLPNPQVIFYLDGVEVERFDATAPFHVPEGVLLDMASGPGFPTTGSPEELDCQYIRCWAPH